MGVLAGSLLFNLRTIISSDSDTPDVEASPSSETVPSPAEMDQMVAAAIPPLVGAQQLAVWILKMEATHTLPMWITIDL